MLGLYATGAALERDNIIERTLRGKRARVMSGKVYNYGCELYGYRRDKQKGIREIYEPEAEVIRRIFIEYVKARGGLLALARQLNHEKIPTPGSKRNYKNSHPNVWYESTLQRILRAPEYKGEGVAYKYHMVKRTGRKVAVRSDESKRIKLPSETTPMIISPELWEQAQIYLNNSRGHCFKNRQHPTLLRGHIFCAECGKPMYYNGSRGEGFTAGKKLYRYYMCSSRWSAKVATCPVKQVKFEDVELWAWQQITQRMENPAEIQKQLERRAQKGANPRLLEELVSCDRKLKRVEQELQRAVNRLMSVDDDLLALAERRIAELKQQRIDIFAERDSLNRRINAQQLESNKLKTLNDYCNQVTERLNKFQHEDKRKLVEALGVKVIASGGQYKMELAIPLTTPNKNYAVPYQIYRIRL